MRQRLPYEGVLIFGPMLASKNSKGNVSVCGTYQLNWAVHRGVMDKRPYVGRMVNVPPIFGFVPIVIANDSSTGPVSSVPDLPPSSAFPI